jgi:hypothetical protein
MGSILLLSILNSLFPGSLQKRLAQTTPDLLSTCIGQHPWRLVLANANIRMCCQGAATNAKPYRFAPTRSFSLPHAQGTYNGERP